MRVVYQVNTKCESHPSSQMVREGSEILKVADQSCSRRVVIMNPAIEAIVRNIVPDQLVEHSLVNELSENPSAAAEEWFTTHLLGSSASSLRFARRVARFDAVARIKSKLDEVESLYLQELMATHDAVEGLQAFVEKRTVNWEHR